MLGRAGLFPVGQVGGGRGVVFGGRLGVHESGGLGDDRQGLFFPQGLQVEEKLPGLGAVDSFLGHGQALGGRQLRVILGVGRQGPERLGHLVGALEFVGHRLEFGSGLSGQADNTLEGRSNGEAPSGSSQTCGEAGKAGRREGLGGGLLEPSEPVQGLSAGPREVAQFLLESRVFLHGSLVALDEFGLVGRQFGNDR